jgi:membrane protein implicated in regulation of membrane protease activity
MTTLELCCMNSSARGDLKLGREGGIGNVRRRHIIFVGGYDPAGAESYFDLFQRTCEQSKRLWPVSLTLQPREVDSADFAQWLLNVRGSNWHCATHYDFLRQENFVRADMAGSLASQVFRGLTWVVGDLVSGTQFRIFCAAWRFGLALSYFYLLLIAWLIVPALIGLMVGRTATDYRGLSVPVAIIMSLIAALVSLFALRPFVEKCRLIQISSGFHVLRRFGRGQTTWLDQAIEVGARRVLAVAHAADADELAVVGHSSGGIIASAIISRSLELDPDLGRRGPRLVLSSLGSVMPFVALHPAAQRMKNIVAHLATAPALTWINCESRKDVLCFADFDPVNGIGINVGTQRCNPLTWRINFKDLVTPEKYRRFRWHRLRMHCQYFMAADRPGPYDYVLLVGGPIAMAEWPKRHPEVMYAIIQNGASGDETAAMMSPSAPL